MAASVRGMRGAARAPRRQSTHVLPARAPGCKRPPRQIQPKTSVRFAARRAQRGERFSRSAPDQTLCLTSGGSALRGATGHVATLPFVARFLLRDMIAGEFCVRCQQIAPLPLHSFLRLSPSFLVHAPSNLLLFIFLPAEN